MLDNNSIGELISATRNELKITQAALADKVGVARSTVGKWEEGKITLTVDNLMKLCKIFDCDFGYLIGEYECKKKDTTDIHKATGLSEKAINILCGINSIVSAPDFKNKADKMILNLISELICFIPENTLIYEYLIRDEYEKMILPQMIAHLIADIMEQYPNKPKVSEQQYIYDLYSIEDAFKEFIKFYMKSENTKGMLKNE